MEFETLFPQGLSLMAYGMSTVFAFLLLLILSIKMMTFIVVRFTSTASLSELAECPAISPLTLRLLQEAIDEHRKHQR